MLLRVIGAVYTRDEEAPIARAKAAALGRVEFVGLNLATSEFKVNDEQRTELKPNSFSGQC
jgi:hypothetical protein